MIPTAFDTWLIATLDREGPFTMFLILMIEEPTTIVPVRSSYLHVIGPDIRWDELTSMMDEAESDWHRVAIFAAKATEGGPLPDAQAGRRLDTLQAAVIRDRLTIRKGELFDRLGRRLEINQVLH